MSKSYRQKAEGNLAELGLGLGFILVVGAWGASAAVLDAGNTGEGLTAEYRFDTGAGDIAYDTAGDSDGALENGAEWSEGLDGKSVSLDGQDDYVSVPHDNNLNVGNGELTVAGWAYLREDSDGNNWMLFDKGTSEPGTYYLYSDGNNLRMTVKDGSNRYDATADPSIVPQGRWVFFTGVYDGSNVELWMNAQKVAETSAPGSLGSNEQPLWIGEYQNGNYELEGEVDQAGVYSTALNSSEIESLYNSGSWRIGTTTEEDDPSKALDVSFQHQNSSHVFDTSGYENHLKPQNGASQTSTINCKAGRCFSFDGSDDFLNTSDSSSLDATKGVTLMAWVRPIADMNDFPRIIQKGQNSAYGIYISDGGTAPTLRIRGSNSHDYNSQAPLPKNEWTHIAATYNASTGKGIFYYDGKVVRSEVSGSGDIGTNSAPLRIGTRKQKDTAWEGIIDQAKVFNRSLSQKEIVEEIEKLDSDGAVLDLQFNRDGGDRVIDSSLEDNHGLLKPRESSGPSRKNGFQGGYLDFDNTNDYVNIQDSDSLDIDNSFTWSVWVKPDSIGGDSTVFGKTGAYELTVRNGDFKIVSWGDDWFPSHRMSEGEWHHVVVTGREDGSSRALYVDGRKVAEGGPSYVMDESSNPLQVGRWPDQDGRGVDGKISRLKILDHRITQERVKKLHKSGTQSIRDTTTERTPQPVLSQTFDRVERCGKADTLSCPPGANGKISVDESGEANHAELFNGARQREAGDCRVGGCLELDGLDDYASTNPGVGRNLQATPRFSTSSWVKPNEIGDQVVVYKYNDNDPDHGFYIQLKPDGDVRFITRDKNAGIQQEYYDVNYDADEWLHLAAVKDGYGTSNMRLYANGREVTDVTESTNQQMSGFSNSEPVTLGYYRRSSLAYFNGTIDQAKLYNKSLSSRNIWRLYTQGRDRSTSTNGPMKHFTGSANLQSVTDRIGEDGTLGSTKSRELNDPDVASGYIGTGLEFDDSNKEYVEVENPVDPTKTSESMSVSFWLNPDSGTGENTIVEWSQSGPNAQIWQYETEDDFYFNPTGTCSRREAEGAIKLGQWAHYTVLYDAPDDEFRWYVDGDPVKTASESCEIDTSSDKLRLGRRVGDRRALDGGLDEVKIYPYALSTDQVQEEANAGIRADDSGYSVPRSCSEVQERNDVEVSGLRRIDPDGAGGQPPVKVYCGNGVDGGGWTLVYNYDHKGGTNPNVVEGKWPRSENAFSHVDGIDSYGFQASEINEVRFYCRTSNHDREVHYKTEDRDVVQGIMDNSTTIGYQSVANDSAKLEDHSGFLPDAATKDTGESEPSKSMFGPAFPMYESGDYHWSIGEPNRGGNRWECDDYPNNAQHDTLHQIWIR